MMFARLLRHFIKTGSVIMVDHHGRLHSFGHPEPGGPAPVTFRVHDAATSRRLFLQPRLAVGEAYMDGALTVDDGRLYEFLDILTTNLGKQESIRAPRLQKLYGQIARYWQQQNPLGLARRNVSHHYDLSGQLYELFLDADWQYSCAYFPGPDFSLEAAQEAKKVHLAAKLLLKPGLRVLDIGSGWGGLAIHLAKAADVEVVGVTLSEEQHKVSNRRAAEAGLADRVRFELRDYREVDGEFDRIVSVGMFEHVGVPYYPQFFGKIEELLAEDGVALLHSIGRMEGPSTTGPWLRKYIFPGGYSPALSEVVPLAERCGLWITDIEILRLHYAMTLRNWRQRFQANRDKVKALYDERFCRMWEFYLAGAELAFRNGGHLNFQMQMAKHVDAVPLTRDYIAAYESGTAKSVDNELAA
jgi:cyclopropane-fatty-acyl-phospholipid synthase